MLVEPGYVPNGSTQCFFFLIGVVTAYVIMIEYEWRKVAQIYNIYCSQNLLHLILDWIALINSDCMNKPAQPMYFISFQCQLVSYGNLLIGESSKSDATLPSVYPILADSCISLWYVNSTYASPVELCYNPFMEPLFHRNWLETPIGQQRGFYFHYN